MPSAVDPWADAGSLSPYRLDMDHDGEVSHKEMRKHNKLNGAARVGYSMPASNIAVCRFSRVCYGVLVSNAAATEIRNAGAPNCYPSNNPRDQ